MTLWSSLNATRNSLINKSLDNLGSSDLNDRMRWCDVFFFFLSSLPGRYISTMQNVWPICGTCSRGTVKWCMGSQRLESPVKVTRICVTVKGPHGWFGYAAGGMVDCWGESWLVSWRICVRSRASGGVGAVGAAVAQEAEQKVVVPWASQCWNPSLAAWPVNILAVVLFSFLHSIWKAFKEGL